MWSTPRPGRFIFGDDPSSIVRESGWTPVPVWIRAKNVVSTGIGTSDIQPVASRYTDYAISVMPVSWLPTKEPLLGEIQRLSRRFFISAS